MTTSRSLPSTLRCGILSAASLGQVGLGAVPLDLRAHCHQVVFDDEDARQLVEAGQVQRLVECALVDGAVAEERERYAAGFLVPATECETRSKRNLSADDSVAAVADFAWKQCIDPPLPREYPPDQAGQLGHHPLRIHPGGEHMAMVAVGGHSLVAVLGRRFDPDDDRLLTDVEVAEPADQTHPVELPGLLLEAADEQHLAIELQQFVLGCVRLRGASRGRHRQIPPIAVFGLPLNYLNYIGVCRARNP